MASFRVFSRFLRGWDRSLGATFRSLNRFTQGFIVRAWNWSRSRNWFLLLKGFPALVTIIAIGAIVTLRLSVSAQDVQAHYLEKAKEDYDKKDYDAAMVCYERLASLGNNNPDSLYRMALIYEKRKDFDRCLRIMNQLAPLDQKGYGRAHFWMANFSWNRGGRDARALAERHFRFALEQLDDAADRLETRTRLAELLSTDPKRLEEAEMMLERLVRERPEAGMFYANVLARRDKKRQADDAATKSLDYFKTRALKDRTDVRATIGWFTSLVFLKRYDEAKQVLATAPNAAETPIYRTAMANLYYELQITLAKKEPDKVGEQLALLEEGLDLDGRHEGLLANLLNFVGSEDPKTATQARESVRKVLARGKSTTASAHLLLGMAAWRENDQEKAIQHLELAVTQNPNLIPALNNYAEILASRVLSPRDQALAVAALAGANDADRLLYAEAYVAAGSGNLDKALQLVTHAVMLAPNNLSYRDTRGHIFMKTKRWDLAIIDFEQVCQRDDLFPNVHRTLAEAYDHFDSDLAAEHRRLQKEADDARQKSRK